MTDGALYSRPEDLWKRLFAWGHLSAMAIGSVVVFFLATIDRFVWIEDVYTFVSQAAVVSLVIALLVFTPLAFQRDARGFAQGGFQLVSFLNGIGFWLLAVLLVEKTWQLPGLITGFAFFGIGVVPAGFVAAIQQAQWDQGAMLLFGLLTAICTRLAALALSDLREREAREQEVARIYTQLGIAPLPVAPAFSRPRRTDVFTHAGSPAARKVELSELVRAGMIAAPTEIIHQRDGVEPLTAQILSDGSVEFCGMHYESLSSAARAASAQPDANPNGWQFWRFWDLETLRYEELQTLCKRYLQEVERLGR